VELISNLKTAKTLGLTVTLALLGRADEVTNVSVSARARLRSAGHLDDVLDVSRSARARLTPKCVDHVTLTRGAAALARATNALRSPFVPKQAPGMQRDGGPPLVD
jgi:hypothetical protein